MKNKYEFFLGIFSCFTLGLSAQSSKVSTLNAPSHAVPSITVTQTCNPACTNLDFSDANLTGWYGYYAANNSSNTVYFITSPVGGSLGPVVKGAGPDAITSNTYQVHLTSAGNNDYFLKTFAGMNMPQASPFGGNYSAMVGDSTNPLQGVGILSQTFNVTSVNDSISYSYALLIENPPSGAGAHSVTQQPFFKITLLDANGDTIPNSAYTINSSEAATTGGFKGIYYVPNTDSVYWKDWTQVTVPLSNYIGQCVTIQFEAADCSLGEHFCYAYVSVACGSVTNVASISNNFTDLNTYPNPSNGAFTLNYSLTEGANVRTTLVNELGQMVYDKTEQKNAGSITEQVNVEGLASGVYSVRMQTDNSIAVRKVVIMNK